VKHIRQSAHGPGGVALAPDRLPQREGGVHRRRCPVNTVYPQTARE
jgi:hypothetical protein